MITATPPNKKKKKKSSAGKRAGGCSLGIRSISLVILHVRGAKRAPRTRIGSRAVRTLPRAEPRAGAQVKKKKRPIGEGFFFKKKKKKDQAKLGYHIIRPVSDFGRSNGRNFRFFFFCWDANFR